MDFFKYYYELINFYIFDVFNPMMSLLFLMLSIFSLQKYPSLSISMHMCVHVYTYICIIFFNKKNWILSSYWYVQFKLKIIEFLN